MLTLQDIFNSSKKPVLHVIFHSEVCRAFLKEVTAHFVLSVDWWLWPKNSQLLSIWFIPHSQCFLKSFQFWDSSTFLA